MIESSVNGFRILHHELFDLVLLPAVIDDVARTKLAQRRESRTRDVLPGISHGDENAQWETSKVIARKERQFAL